MNTETIDKLYKEHIAHDELPKEFQIGMECFLDALKAQSAATPPDVEQMAEDVLIKQHENWNPYEGTLKEGVIIPAMIAMYQAGQSAVQDATPLPKATITHKNGGFEQGILEAVNQDGLLNDADKKRLEHLQSLPPNRTEIRGQDATPQEGEMRQITITDLKALEKSMEFVVSENMKLEKELSTLRSELSAAQEENNKLREVLGKIANWELPSTGKYWDAEEKDPMSYGACYGSNGERDYMKAIAKTALTPPESGEQTK